jgi:tRNA threonylcarbamoyladenosine biosynthesis protein TsaE
MRFISTSADMTRRLGARLAKKLKSGDVLLLAAQLGAGKTTFVQGLARGLGADDEAMSPTFVIAQTLPGRLPLHHLDFYRLSKKEIVEMGIHDYLTGSAEIEKGVVAIEWPERCPEVWPPEHLRVTLRIKPGSTARIVTLEGKGKRMKSIVSAMAER